MGVTFGLWHYMKHMAHLQNLKQLKVTCKCCTKREGEGKGTEDNFRVLQLYSSCSSSWVSSGFTAGCLKKVAPC